MNMEHRGKGSRGSAEKKQLPPHLRPKFAKPKTGQKASSREERTAIRPSKERVEEEGPDPDKEKDKDRDKEKDRDKDKEKEKDRRDRKSGEREEEEAECRDDDDEDAQSKERPSKEEMEEKATRNLREEDAKMGGKKESPARSKKGGKKKKTSSVDTTEYSRKVAKAEKWLRKKKKTSLRRRGSFRSTRSKRVRNTPPSKPSNSSGSASKIENQKEEKKTSKGQKKRSNETAKKDQDRKGFFQKIIDKTKFWRKQSDCVAHPTPEMLIKPCVAPEYDVLNHKDFSPDPHFLFPNEEDWKLRLKNNHSAPDEIFVNRRPFWTRTAEDVVPKMGQLSISAEQLGTPPLTPPHQKPPRRRHFYDPRLDAVEKMIAVESESTEQLLTRVKANTIQATIAMHAVKKDTFPAVRKKEDTMMANLPQARFIVRDRPEHLNVYNRKDRPKPGHSRRFYVVDYSARTKKAKKKRSKEEPKDRNASK